MRYNIAFTTSLNRYYPVASVYYIDDKYIYKYNMKFYCCMRVCVCLSNNIIAAERRRRSAIVVPSFLLLYTYACRDSPPKRHFFSSNSYYYNACVILFFAHAQWIATNRSRRIFTHKYTGLNVVENCKIKITLAHWISYNIIYVRIMSYIYIYIYAAADDDDRRGQWY